MGAAGLVAAQKGAEPMVTAQDVRAVALSLPRTEEHLIYDHVKFRVGKIVYVAITPDETTVGFAFPREERPALISAEPDRFFVHRPSDARFNWIDTHMATITLAEMREFVTDAWRMVVPKRLAAAHLDRPTPGPGDDTASARSAGPSAVNLPARRGGVGREPKGRRKPLLWERAKPGQIRRRLALSSALCRSAIATAFTRRLASSRLWRGHSAARGWSTTTA
jgi:hypothetical protein